MKDVFYRTQNLGDLTLRGSSRASIQSFWNVPEFSLGLDVGAHPWDFTRDVSRLFISHTHRDHVAGLYHFIARRSKLKCSVPEIFVPQESLAAVRRFLEVWQEMDQSRYPFHLHGISAGERVSWQTEDGRSLEMEALQTHHRIPSLGYAVWENGEPRIAYSGDTLVGALDENPVFYESEILILEMTAADEFYSPAGIHHFGHVHFQDVLDRREFFQNRWICLAHFTCKRTLAELRRNFAWNFPNAWDERLIFWEEGED